MLPVQIESRSWQISQALAVVQSRWSELPCPACDLLACGYEVSLALVVSWSVRGFTLHVLFPARHKAKL